MPAMERRWAEIDDDWRRKEERAIGQREANAAAARGGRLLPFPNPFDRWDPTKLSPEEADDPEAILRRHRRLRKICRPPKPRRYIV